MKDESSFDIDNKTNPVQTVAPTNKEENEMIGATDKIRDRRKFCVIDKV